MVALLFCHVFSYRCFDALKARLLAWFVSLDSLRLSNSNITVYCILEGPALLTVLAALSIVKHLGFPMCKYVFIWAEKCRQVTVMTHIYCEGQKH